MRVDLFRSSGEVEQHYLSPVRLADAIARLIFIAPEQELEVNRVIYEERPARLYCNGLGEELNLPFNLAATVVYRRGFLTLKPDLDPDVLSAIYGDAAVVAGAPAI